MQPTTDRDKLIEALEFLCVKDIIELLRQNKITEADAREIARSFLSYLPVNTIEDIEHMVQQFVADYPDFLNLKEYIDAHISHKALHAAVQEAVIHLKNGSPDEAFAVIKHNI